MNVRSRATSFLSAGALLAITLGLAVACAGPGPALQPATNSAAPTTVAQVAAPPARSGAPIAPIAGGASAAPVAPAIAAAPAMASSGMAGSAQALPPIPSPAPGLVRGIVVSGTGSVSARPDQAIVSAGVQTRGQNAQVTQADNNQQMQAVITAITALGIPAKDIQTTGVSLYPIENQNQTITGYNASNNVTIVVENIDQTGQVLDAAVKAGANQASNVRFTIKDQTGLRNKALAAAAADAKGKADALAGALGLQISGVQSVSEQSSGGPIQYGARPFAGAAAASAPSVPVEPGQLSVNADVTIVFSY